MKKLSLFNYLFIALVAMLISACGGGGSDSSPQPTPPQPTPSSEVTVESLQIAPLEANTKGTTELAIHKGNALALAATATYSDGTTKTLSEGVVWQVNSEAAVMEGNKVIGRNVGEVDVSAEYQGVKSNQLTVTVLEAAITQLQLQADKPTLPKGLTASLTVVATYSDGLTAPVTERVAWQYDETLAQISKAGQITWKQNGRLAVTASLDGLSSNEASITLTDAVVKKLQITPPMPSVIVGVQQPFTALATYTDDTQNEVTKSVKWTLDNNEIATINQDGVLVADAKGSGKLALYAEFDNHKSNQANITVVDVALTEIKLTAAESQIPMGLGTQITATGIFNNKTQRDLTQELDWASSESDFVFVTKGKVTTQVLSKKGTIFTEESEVTITASKATQYGLIKADLTLMVTAAEPVKLRPVEKNGSWVSLNQGVTRQLNVAADFTDGWNRIINDIASWRSEDPSIATVNNGLVRASTDKTGKTKVVASFNGLSNEFLVTVVHGGVTEISVTTEKAWVPLGLTSQLKAFATFTDTTIDATTQVTWKVRIPANWIADSSLIWIT